MSVSLLQAMEKRVHSPFSCAVLAIFLTLPSAAWGQMVAPPQTVWGDTYQDPEGLQVGSVEVLAGLLVALAVVFAVVAFLARKQSRLVDFAERAPVSERLSLHDDLRRLRRYLAVCVYLLVPVFGVATILLAGTKAMFGVEVALYAVILSLLSLAFGSGGLLGAAPPPAPALRR